ncbi:hypothetical protein ACN28C_05745 [Plantactinospora sp. WMMC1484]|uniref:hypothetical protein n=1 Tax=Plantactinospora sp. WMMC1484 TaxID=3404122 RepID=UPI003BF5EE1F
MDHRDRGRGELARHEWQDSGARSDPATPWPSDPYARPGGTYRTPSRRRARHRGAPDPTDDYTPSWARESTEPLRPGVSPTSAETSTWAADSDPDRRAGGRHLRADPPTGPSTAGARSPGSSGRRIGPEVTWDSTGEYWHGPGEAGDTAAADTAAGDTAAGRASAAGGWRDTGDTGTRWSAGATGATAGGSAGGPAPDGRATGRRGARRAGGEPRRDETDHWAAAAPTSGWIAAAPTTGGWSDSPTSNGWMADAPTSGAWSAAAPTTGAGAPGDLPDDRYPASRRGRRRRSDPDDDPTAAPTSGWGVGAGDEPAAGATRGGRRRRPDHAETAPSWLDRTEGSGSGRWGGAGGQGDGDGDGGGRAAADAAPRSGRRRRAERAGWQPEDPVGGEAPSAGRRRSRHAAEDPTEVAAPPPEPTSSAGPGEAGRSGATARWIGSSGAAGGGTGSRARGADPSPGAGGWSGIGGTSGRAGRSTREPDAEPVRRDRDSAGPVRGSTEDRGGRARRADPGPSVRSDSGPTSGWRDPGPWERFGDTGMLDPVTDSEPPDTTAGRRRGPSAGSDRWSGPADTGRWDRTDPSGWDRSTDTGHWDRFTDTTEWRHGELTGPTREGDGGRESAVGGAPGAAADRTAEPETGDAFWSGTRLAGDDPRWMGIPDSAPRSPAVAFPPSARPATPARRQGDLPPTPRRRAEAAPVSGRAGVADRTGVAGRGGAVGYARGTGGTGTRAGRRPSGAGSLPSTTRTGRPSPLSRRLEDDLLDAQPSGPLAAVLYTAAWYAVAVLGIFVWVLTLDASVPVDCVPGVSGGCESERSQAMSALLGGVPRFLAALATGLVVAALVRWFNRTWRAVTVGLAAAVVGGGLSTVIFSAISGQPIG